MSDIAIRVEDLGKMYRIGSTQERYKRFTETAMDVLTAPVRRLRNLGKPAPEEETIWALRDVSFEIKRGEAVGIIGRNGAGKSTLLKILSRITEPTTGRVELHGRVSSLLEVGTGFHPELTGRENIYLNGTILGMRRQEIDRKFDEIVAFSGVEKFLDTPVKRYSSGMQVRLAFSVAAHLEPEILLVDEVLAVGDAAFQQKCMGKMGDVAREGRTVLFVSHNMVAIGDLCSRVFLIENGSLDSQGGSMAIIARYMAKSSSLAHTTIKERLDRTGSGRIRFTNVKILADGEEVSCITQGQDVRFEISYEADEPIYSTNARFAISVSTMMGVKFMSFDSSSAQFAVSSMSKQGVLCCHIPKFPLINGRYRGLLYGEINGGIVDRLPDAFEFEVVSGRYPKVGWLAVQHDWSLRQETEH